MNLDNMKEHHFNAKNKERMENRKRIIELLTAVRYTTNDIEKVADEICSLFNVVGQSEQLKLFYKYLVKQGLSPDIDDDFLQQQIDNFN